jgi:hypothetical protein
MQRAWWSHELTLMFKIKKVGWKENIEESHVCDEFCYQLQDVIRLWIAVSCSLIRQEPIVCVHGLRPPLICSQAGMAEGRWHGQKSPRSTDLSHRILYTARLLCNKLVMMDFPFQYKKNVHL